MPDPSLAARQLLTEYDEGHGPSDIPPVPVIDVAQSLLMLKVVEADEIRSVANVPADAPPLSGLLTTDDRTIWIDRREAARSPARKRFTIAHEIGHWILHANRGNMPSDQACEPGDIEGHGDHAALEREANEFANELLMPEQVLSALATECGFNVPFLASRFEVSVRALELRLTRLDLLPAWMRS